MFQTNLREIDASLDVDTVLDYIDEHAAIFRPIARGDEA